MRFTLGKCASNWAWKAAVLLCLCLSLYATIVEPAQLCVRQYTLTLPHWPSSLNGLKLVLISDLHFGALHIDTDKLRQIVKKANAQNADLILLLGDYVCAGNGNCLVKPDEFTSELAGLRAKLGVYAVLGNHDWWYNGHDVRTSLQSAHITVLENAAISLDKNQTHFWLLGLEDSWTRSPSVPATLTHINLTTPVIAMTHNPDIFPHLPINFSIMVAGHTHGGQVSLPLLGPIVVPSDNGTRYAKGIITENNKMLFVTSGIGTSVLPVRFLVPPEISVLTLTSAATPSNYKR